MDLYTIIYFIQTPETKVYIPSEIIDIVKKYIFWWNYGNGYCVTDLSYLIGSYTQLGHNILNYTMNIMEQFANLNKIKYFENIIENRLLYGNTIPKDFNKYKYATDEHVILQYIKKKYGRILGNLKRHQLINIINDFSIPVIHIYNNQDYSFISEFGYTYTITKTSLYIYKNNIKIKTISVDDTIDMTVYNERHNITRFIKGKITKITQKQIKISEKKLIYYRNNDNNVSYYIISKLPIKKYIYNLM